MKISLIICTYNRDKYIYNVLKSIAENEFSTIDYEIVLIDNNSTDNTQDECRRFQNDYQAITFKYFVETNQGLSFARNRGITEAKGNILIYVDDDATVNKDYLQAYYNLFINNPQVFAAGGPIIPVYEEERIPAWMSYFTKPLITGYLYSGSKIKEFKRGKYPGGGNAAYRKEVFEHVGIFNVNLGRNGTSLAGSEEKDIFDKMAQKRMKIYYIPDAVLYHIIPPYKLTDAYFDKLTYDIGRGERIRTLNISHSKYFIRLLSETIKWIASICLCIGYLITFQAGKGFKLLVFRCNVTKGLLNR